MQPEERLSRAKVKNTHGDSVFGVMLPGSRTNRGKPKVGQGKMTISVAGSPKNFDILRMTPCLGSFTAEGNIF